MKIFKAWLLAAAFVLLASSPLHALRPQEIPDPLKTWEEWALKGHESELCPFLNDEQTHVCQWNSPLSLSLGDEGGSFSFQEKVFEDGWVALPGDEDDWPQDVKADGQPVPVVLWEDGPRVYLKKGDYAITGRFFWNGLPESLTLPEEIGVVRGAVGGKPILPWMRHEDGRLWLEGAAAESESAGETDEDTLLLHVYRLMQDEIPFELTTRLVLDVSGKERSLVLGTFLPDGFVPTNLQSSLPAQWDWDEGLKLSLKPGHWVVTLESRHRGPVGSITAPLHEAPWPAEELWAFSAREDLRSVRLSGVPSIDPQQTDFPPEWRNFPVYRVKPGEASGGTISFEEQRRGVADGTPDQLSLGRELWLDFEGGGMTFRDRISGTFGRSSRLEAGSDLRPGRVAVDGRDQLITTLADQKSGVEVRYRFREAVAEGRLENLRNPFPAVGWRHDFQNVSEVLHLPPGWRLLGAWGADSASDTWISQWTLWDMFLALVLALSFAKLWGKGWGLVALVAFALLFPEEGSPHWVWVAVLVLAALLRLNARGRVRWTLGAVRSVSLFVLIAVSFPFMIGQVRSALYPALEDRAYSDGTVFSNLSGGLGLDYYKAKSAPELSPVATVARTRELGGKDQDEKGMEDIAAVPEKAKKEPVPPPPPQSPVPRAEIRVAPQPMYLPGAKIQTGPGVPQWQWREVSLRWNGPVRQDQTLRLYFIPPWANILLAFLRVSFLLLLILCVLDLPPPLRPRFFGKKISAVAGLLLAALLASSQVARADFPSEDVLNQLQRRLLEKPECYPDCGSVSRMRVEANSADLILRLEIHVAAASAVPLPGSFQEWSPVEVVVDGREEPAGQKGGVENKEKREKKVPRLSQTEDGRLWIQLDPGVHQVVLVGPLPARPSVQVALPWRPYRTESKLSGWTLEGVDEDGVAEENLRLARNETLPQASEPNTADTGVFPPFVRIERHIRLGMNWEVETKMIRLAPPGIPIMLNIPLLEGESVTTKGLSVENEKVRVSLSPQEAEVGWRSVLLESDGLRLRAPEESEMTPWVEVWDVTSSPIWHVKAEGIPQVRIYDAEGTWNPQWRPWPGEEASLSILRPDAVEGPTRTIDQSRLTLTPGTRSTEAVLSFNIRSSLGEQRTVALPEGSELESVAINGSAQSIRPVGTMLTLPLAPGTQNIEVRWRQPTGLGTFFQAPMVQVGLPSVNASVQINMPPRWIVFTWGPRLGPAVLFWGFLLVILVVARILGKIVITPLLFSQWFLLGLGLSQVSVWASLVVVAWFLALGWRRYYAQPAGTSFWKRSGFNLLQVTLVLLTLAAVAVLFVSIQHGLLWSPDMQITGNGSTDSLLQWYQDRSDPTLPRPWVVSLPLYAYRIVMLGWAIWIAASLLKWLKWGWESFSTGEIWRRKA